MEWSVRKAPLLTPLPARPVTALITNSPFQHTIQMWAVSLLPSTAQPASTSVAPKSSQDTQCRLCLISQLVHRLPVLLLTHLPAHTDRLVLQCSNTRLLGHTDSVGDVYVGVGQQGGDTKVEPAKHFFFN